MILNFIFSNVNAIKLGIYFVFLCVVAIRFFRPVWVKNISYIKLFFIVLGLNLFYVLFISWGQYYVWSTASDVSRAILNSPLPSQVPFSSYLEWMRPLFMGTHGYFLFYIFGRFWLNLFIALITSGVLYLIFRVWQNYKSSFLEEGPLVLLILMLISGYPSNLVMVPIGFILSVIVLIISYFRGVKNVVVEPFFIFATFFTLFFANIILSYVL
jgi:hypothetical protein